MKVTITYLPGEERKANIVKAFIRGLFGDNYKVRESDRHTPYKHIYLATREHPATPAESSEK